MREKLTPAFVKKEAAANQRVVYWDEAMPGFGLMVTPKGHKSFVVQYRAGAHSRRVHLKAGLKRRRQRVLSDDELRAVWRAAEASANAFSYLVQFLLLTAARRTEAAAMRRREVSGEEWTIPQERYKTGLELVVPLSDAAVAVLAAVPKIGKSGLVFTTDGKRPLAGFSKFKRAFDANVLAEIHKQDPEASFRAGHCTT